MLVKGKARWCAGCAKKAHAGVVDIVHKKCEDCGVKTLSFELPVEGKSGGAMTARRGTRGRWVRASSIRSARAVACNPRLGRRRRGRSGVVVLKALVLKTIMFF
jgi:hypothetical protein